MRNTTPETATAISPSSPGGAGFWVRWIRTTVACAAVLSLLFAVAHSSVAQVGKDPLPAFQPPPFQLPTPMNPSPKPPGQAAGDSPFVEPLPIAPQDKFLEPVAQAGSEPKSLPQPTQLPQPKTINSFGFEKRNLDALACPPTIGTTPRVTPELQQKYNQYVDQIIDAKMTLELIIGRTRLMKLKRTPKRVQIGDDSVAGYTLLSTKEISLQGKQVGSTVLTLWFPDPTDPQKEVILSYHVSVFPDPEHQKRVEAVYQELARQINCVFKDSNVCLKMVGDKIVVTGFAHDIHEATQILRIVRANAPDPRDPSPVVAKVPFAPVPNPVLGELTPEGFQPIGVAEYQVAGGPNVINLLRVPGEQQVMLRVTVAEVNRAAARSIGMNFTLLNNQGQPYFANNTGLIGTGGIAPVAQGGGGGIGLLNLAGAANTFGISSLAGFPSGAGGFNNLPAAIDNGQIRLAISALRNLNYARSLAEPNLVTMNGQTATFKAGGEFPVPVVTSNGIGGLQGVSFLPFGVQLSFTPYITDRDRIKLSINASVSSRDLAAGTTNIGGAAIPNLISRNFQTVVELREGQTLAVAGLIQNNLGADAHRIPLFGDIPILNRLTGFDRITAGEQELVVLVTPELVHPMEPHEVPPLPGSDLFEPNDLEFYLLGRIESHYPVDYRSPIRTDLGRMQQYHTMERLYLTGPHGYVPEP
jgi:pilus assembly protein CpaC